MFQVFKYIKSCLVEKILSLQISKDTLATDFVIKYNTFFQVIYSELSKA